MRPGGQLVDDREVEVGVLRLRERARDRRGRHVERVRCAALGAQLCALLDAELVLFVDDHQAQPRELDTLREQRMRADGKRRFARDETFVGVAACARALRAEDCFDCDPNGSSSGASLAACWAARISVGAIERTLHAAEMASTMAAAATSVLPLPTSPCSKRFIGAVRAMSCARCSITRACAPVGVNGSSAVEARPPVGRRRDRRRPARGFPRARLSAAASATPKNSSNTMRRRPRSISSSSRGAWTPRHASAPAGKSCFARRPAGARRRARRSGVRGSWQSPCG